MSTSSSLPPFAPFPESAWRAHLVPDEWAACLDAWIALAEVHIALSLSDFNARSLKDESLVRFITTYTRELALAPDLGSSDVSRSGRLRKNTFILSKRLIDTEPRPEVLLDWSFLADLSKAYGKPLASKLVSRIWAVSPKAIGASLGSERAVLIRHLEAGIKGRPEVLEINLKRLNHLIYSSPETAVYFLTGSDFLDGLVSCYTLMNPPLRKAIISCAYLCLIGLTENENSKLSLLIDQLYALKSAAEAHKAGPTNVRESMVAELVTVTPILKQVQYRIERSGIGSGRANSVIMSLETFRKSGESRPKKFTKRRIDKGKSRATGPIEGQSHVNQVHIHQMSLVTQVQDLFPDLGSGFVVKLLDEYNDDVEQVISHLLEGSLPAHLDGADRTGSLLPTSQAADEVAPDLVPRSTPPLIPTRRNVFDDDELDQLTVDTSRLQFGRRNPEQTADSILQDRANAPNKAAILSALAAFDSDDDEGDDTYDVEDVGGTVDSEAPGNDPEQRQADSRDPNDEALFRALKASPAVFGRDAETRRGKARAALKDETRMTDEAIEGWALMLARDPRRLRRLEAQFSHFSGAQPELAPTGWRADSGTEDSEADGGGGRGRGGGYWGRGRGGAGRGRGNVAGPTGDKDTEAARYRKEANKGSRANHNRRDQRARKMARGGFPA